VVRDTGSGGQGLLSLLAPRARRFSTGPIAAAVLGGPAFGVAVGAVDGGSVAVFLVCCCAAAVFASVYSSGAGLWWVATALPPVIAVCAILSELTWHPKRSAYQGSKQ
jgi:hypothetical protein